jgi:hypothetical protein
MQRHWHLPWCQVDLTIATPFIWHCRRRHRKIAACSELPISCGDQNRCRSLHWLPVQFRINFKINVLTFKTLSTEQPSYLHNLLNKVTQSRSLRSNKGLKLSIPRVKTKMGSRSFGSCAPALWNSLPLSLRSATSVVTFRKLLKAHLFGLAYPP